MVNPMTTPTTHPISAVIVDDEPLAREGLRLRLQQHPQVIIVAECQNMEEAEAALKKYSPDVIFLDIEIPQLNSLDYLLNNKKESSGFSQERPWIIFVTAYHNYAVDAFNVNALDYLVKPVEQSRLQQALIKVEDRITHLQQSGNGPELPSPYVDKLIIKEQGSSMILPCDTIDWIEAAGDYMGVHAGGAVHILRTTMKELEQDLDPKIFKRIHRSIIVNTRQIHKISPHTSGESFLHLKCGDKLKVSRSYKNKIRDFL